MKKFILPVLCSFIIGTGIASDIGYNKYGELNNKQTKIVQKAKNDMTEQLKANQSLKDGLAKEMQTNAELEKQIQQSAQSNDQLQAQVNSLQGQLEQARKK